MTTTPELQGADPRCAPVARCRSPASEAGAAPRGHHYRGAGFGGQMRRSGSEGLMPVDLRARGDAKANHEGRCAGRVRGRAVPDLREVAAIEVQVERAGVRGGPMIRSAVFDLHTESPIEGRGRLHVAPDEVELVQSMTSRRGAPWRRGRAPPRPSSTSPNIHTPSGLRFCYDPGHGFPEPAAHFLGASVR